MTLITNNDHLKTLCEELSTQEYITVDTEFLRDKFYYPKLCLLQVASEETEFAIDPLVPGIDLSPLFEVFANPKIVKVFHSARQDIEIILNMSGKVPAPLFDTQVAAMVCGFGASASYAMLVSEIVKKNVDKSSRFTDWSRRPLSADQLNYAISDVTHLRDVYKRLKLDVEENDRVSWLREEMAYLINPENYIVNVEKVWEKLKPKGASRRFLGVLKELAKWRELTAQSSNKPKTHIIKDQVLLEIAAMSPKTPAELQAIRGVGGLKKSAEIEIIDAIERGQNLPEDVLPERKKYIKKTESNEAFIELLKVLLKAVCEEKHVAEKLVASSDDLNKIAAGDDVDSHIFNGWRHEIFGKYVQDLRAGKIALSIKNGKIVIVQI
jgi:ribonuclease D